MNIIKEFIKARIALWWGRLVDKWTGNTRDSLDYKEKKTRTAVSRPTFKGKYRFGRKSGKTRGERSDPCP